MGGGKGRQEKIFRGVNKNLEDPHLQRCPGEGMSKGVAPTDDNKLSGRVANARRSLTV